MRLALGQAGVVLVNAEMLLGLLLGQGGRALVLVAMHLGRLAGGLSLVLLAPVAHVGAGYSWGHVRIGDTNCHVCLLQPEEALGLVEVLENARRLLLLDIGLLHAVGALKLLLDTVQVLIK